MARVDTAAVRLRRLREGGCTPAQAWELFDSLPAVRVDAITTGRWHGDELDTGHPWGGLLGESGWRGKQFDDPETVQPLLFSGPDRVVFPVDPRRVPLALAGRVPARSLRLARRMLPVLRPFLRARTPGARLRDLEYRGSVSAAMIYDHLPIIDVFRAVDDDTLLGVMDRRGMPEPYFFVLHRERP
ncbi:DUF4334 domain-containing protein [Streptomyces sp. A7024]|uniref:DUF4334 domain-containing protein n=1 Tax=Streptomyces coryli TaxID=1128680 RepID=A0A6G4TUA6_9ACTN|nr:DUF4334 domain-containing protein [Streptomyces coryli]NGN63130.1 DUF4334 domain-containing protein [Streptomyces coryli]